jgi:hypothetical protein
MEMGKHPAIDERRLFAPDVACTGVQH